jgi:ribose transport system substrate-binding protein
MSFSLPGRRLVAGLTLAVALVTTAGCGGASNGASASGDSDAAAANAAAAQERVQAEMADVTSGVPTEGPTAVPGKFVVMIPCAEASEGCAQPARGAKEAAELLGWRVQIIDGGGTADTQAAAVRQAVTLDADGIITFAIDPKTIQGAVQEARSAGIKFLAQSTNKTDLVDFSDIPDAEGWKASGSYLADYAIAKTDGNVRALVLHDTGFETMIQRHAAFVDQLKACSTCEILDEQQFTFADLATSVPQTVQQMAQTNPDFNVIYIDYDYAVSSVLQGLKAIGRDDVIVLGSDRDDRLRTGLGRLGGHRHPQPHLRRHRPRGRRRCPAGQARRQDHRCRYRWPVGRGPRLPVRLPEALGRLSWTAASSRSSGP